MADPISFDQKRKLPDGGIRFKVNLLPGYIFVRYPVETPAPEGTIGFITDGETWQRAGIFKDGEWRGAKGQPLKQKPKFWTVMEEKHDAG
jgi:hypothetical protein